ncbi:MAG: SoxR reducing system RseC family protein [Candidatus Brocadiia bacterium]
MKKIEHIGEVVEVEDGKAVVRLEAGERCGIGFSCACCASVKPDARTVRVSGEGLEVGDTVQVAIPAYTGYLSTFVVFILPIGLFVAGMIVGGMLESGQANDMGPLIGGAVGFGIAVAIALAVNRMLGRADRFEVRRIRQGQGS